MKSNGNDAKVATNNANGDITAAAGGHHTTMVVVTPVNFFGDENIVPRLHDVLKNTQKEKVIRVVLATMKNLIKSSNRFITDMVSVSVPKTLQNLMKRNFEDKDIQDDLKSLVDLLEQYIEEISSFDEYRQEVLSGRLQWSPVHESEKFWKENLSKFEQNNFFIVRELIKVLGNPELPTGDNETAGGAATSLSHTRNSASSVRSSYVPVASKEEEYQNLAIACHDLGQFVRFFPRGKQILSQLGAKPKILSLMEHPNSEVRKHALLCTQKLMVSRWEYLQ